MYVVGTIEAGTYGEVLSLESGETTSFDLPGRVPGFDPAWSDNNELVTYVAGWHREYVVPQAWGLNASDCKTQSDPNPSNSGTKSGSFDGAKAL